jgi:hypothetical protein
MPVGSTATATLARDRQPGSAPPSRKAAVQLVAGGRRLPDPALVRLALLLVNEAFDEQAQGDQRLQAGRGAQEVSEEFASVSAASLGQVHDTAGL